MKTKQIQMLQQPHLPATAIDNCSVRQLERDALALMRFIQQATNHYLDGQQMLNEEVRQLPSRYRSHGHVTFTAQRFMCVLKLA
jgi:hypothetical protein